MIVNLNLLPKVIDEDIVIPEDFYAATDIKGISPLKVSGVIKDTLADDIEINLDVHGSMILVDAISGEDIDVPIEMEIRQNLGDLVGESEKYYQNLQNTLDIIEFLWENIVLEVPISVTRQSGLQMKGDGWELNGTKEDEKIDPRLEALSDIFKGGEE